MMNIAGFVMAVSLALSVCALARFGAPARPGAAALGLAAPLMRLPSQWPGSDLYGLALLRLLCAWRRVAIGLALELAHGLGVDAAVDGPVWHAVLMSFGEDAGQCQRNLFG